MAECVQFVIFFYSISYAEFLGVLLTICAVFFKIVGKGISVYSRYSHVLDRNIFLKLTLTLYSTKADIQMLPTLKKWNCGKSYHHWFEGQIFCNVCYSEKKDDDQSASKTIIKLILRVKCCYTKNMQPQYEISVLLLGHLYWHLMMALPAQYEAWKPVTSQDLRFLGWKFLRLAVNTFKLKLQCNVTIWKPCMLVQLLLFL